jgi:uncharacterized protein
MKFAFTVERSNNANLVRACSPGEVIVREYVIHRSAILTEEKILFDWPPTHVEALRSEHLEAALAFKPEVILLGTGEHQQFPNPAVLLPVQRAGVGVEVMDTAAACRTYNILVQEGRRVVAALILEGR